MADRRRQTRRQADQSLFIYDSKTGTVMGRVADMTEQGVMVFSEKQVQPDTIFHCRIPLPKSMRGPDEITFEAQSKWCLLDEKTGMYHAGYEFHVITAENRTGIRKLLKSWSPAQPETIKT